MSSRFLWQVLSLALLILPLCVQSLRPIVKEENGVKSAVYLSPMFVLGPGSVENKFYYGVDFPTGHIGLKDFNAEVIDEMGNPIPLYEAYLHHWLVRRYYGLKGTDEIHKQNNGKELNIPSEIIELPNSGPCPDNIGQIFSRGSEARKTASEIPAPYGIEVGNPEEVPEGYEERFMIQAHVIDTRGVEDRLGCMECECAVYINMTMDQDGHPLEAGYVGGASCCYDQTRCTLKQGIMSSMKKSYYLRYTVKWVDWDDTVVPVKVYMLDITDHGEAWKSKVPRPKLRCEVEYNVKACEDGDASRNGCIENRKTKVVMRNGGHIVYVVGHQHKGGIGTAIYREDGRVICNSPPIYGQGNEAGNEAGYIVGMSACYPQPGSMKISAGETIVLESNYSSIPAHYGVMGIFYMLVAEQPQNLQLPYKYPDTEHSYLSG